MGHGLLRRFGTKRYWKAKFQDYVASGNSLNWPFRFRLQEEQVLCSGRWKPGEGGLPRKNILTVNIRKNDGVTLVFRKRR